MSAADSTERMFAMPAFEGLRILLTYREKHPELPNNELLRIIEKLEIDGSTLDFEAALHLEQIVPTEDIPDGLDYYRLCIKSVLLFRQPVWAKAMSQGRNRFIRTLSANDQSIFEGAGILQDPPDAALVEWWDGVCGEARAAIDREKMRQARAAEALSIALEIKELAKLGINQTPSWTGLDDNFAGYDVKSYRLVGNIVQPKLIEVKSTTASPLRFFITRNEWNTALKFGEAYVFHVWDMSVKPERLFVRTNADVMKNIPEDQMRGQWKSAQIPVG